MLWPFCAREAFAIAINSISGAAHQDWADNWGRSPPTCKKMMSGDLRSRNFETWDNPHNRVILQCWSPFSFCILIF